MVLATEANIESGEQIVDGGSTDKTHINGGTQTVQNYGKAINTDIVSGLQQIMVNGTAEGSIINGGSQVVNEGGLAENSVLNDGGTLDVREKGSATGIQQSSQARWLQPPERRGSQGHALMASRSASSRMRRTISCWQMAAC